MPITEEDIRQAKKYYLLKHAERILQNPRIAEVNTRVVGLNKKRVMPGPGDTKETITRTLETEEDFVQLWVLGDLHFGNIAFAEDKCAQTINMLKELGDLVISPGIDPEAAFKESVSNIYEAQRTPDEERYIAIDVLEPIATQIVGITTCNHSARFKRAMGQYYTFDVCRELGIPYLDSQAIVKLVINGIEYTLYVTHGKTGAQMPGTRMNAIWKMSQLCPSADIFISGHIHQKYSFLDYVLEDRAGVTYQRPRLFTTCGSFIHYFGSYAADKTLHPGAIGAKCIHLGAKQKEFYTIEGAMCPE